MDNFPSMMLQIFKASFKVIKLQHLKDLHTKIWDAWYGSSRWGDQILSGSSLLLASNCRLRPSSVHLVPGEPDFAALAELE